MLILSRRAGEEVIVGNKEIKVVILEIKGKKVRLGIEAAKEISIYRNELFDKLTETKRAA